MATDLGRILGNITRFYPFAGKTILHVGAGGGQLAGYAAGARRVVAVDPDEAALEKLRQALSKMPGIAGLFELRREDFLRVSEPADVVFFEFCLHEITDPAAALEHARALAPDVVVADHAAGSPWSYLAAEERKVELSWAAVGRHAPRKRAAHEAAQRFNDFDELEAKIKPHCADPSALGRLDAFRGKTPIEVRMPYELALI